MSGAQPCRRICVYDGARLLGTVRETPDRQGWAAVGPHEEPLGEFRSSVEAALAITTEYDRASAERLRKAQAWKGNACLV